MIDIYGTLGPSCADRATLSAMLQAGMTGIRLNLSHGTLREARPMLEEYRAAAESLQRRPGLLIDLMGPELRIGSLSAPIPLNAGDVCLLCTDPDAGDVCLLCTDPDAGDARLLCTDPGGAAAAGATPADTISADVASSGTTHTGAAAAGLPPRIPLPAAAAPFLKPGQQLLLDDGRLLLEVLPERDTAVTTPKKSTPARVLRGGLLKSRKSAALPGCRIVLPALTAEDLANLSDAASCGVTAVMQPFVRSRHDLLEVRRALADAGVPHVRLMAKIESLEGADMLNELLPEADEIVIARGDLGNAVPLWELPRLQKQIAAACRAAGKPFMVVTQMLSSMEHAAVPTRAEVSDIYNAVLDGASSVMVTGETATGDYPVEVIRYLTRTAEAAFRDLQSARRTFS